MKPETLANFETIGLAILEELDHHDWSNSLHSSVEDLGLAMGTHIGLKRGRNEDRIVVARVCAPNGETYTVAVVCDGVGGSEFGDRAATHAIVAVLFELASQRTRLNLSDLAARLVRCADNHVRHELAGNGTTTLSMILASASGHVTCASVGDSRVYSWDTKGQFLQVTTDDTVENELKQLPGDHQALLEARGLKGRLSQAVGEAGRIAEDLRVQVFSGDHFRTGVILGSDGLWKTAKDFESVMLNARTAIDAVRKGVILANWVGGFDNVSIIAIEDLNKFCRPTIARVSALSRVSISLWLGASKFSFNYDLQPYWSEVAKPEKNKRRIARPKKAFKAAESQLELTEARIASKEPKPVIEVTLGSGTGEGEG